MTRGRTQIWGAVNAAACSPLRPKERTLCSTVSTGELAYERAVGRAAETLSVRRGVRGWGRGGRGHADHHGAGPGLGRGGDCDATGAWLH
ncbi:hypothetical protein SBRY_30811 [Actinacidiphila bryophytorum]|uniref:Uncharacterized protein n=1 Tax=Actinacidiphila bryophytorum TaxID=1436133 RepID=A0A9W4MAA0_9ACTN|nr:hypothetical protein SBRY_30811 [Actinacidiphila bryophytorum]